MVWSGKSFDAGALQINLRMPYGLHSSLNLFPINVYWIFCGANMCVTRLGKQKARESSLWQSVIIMICPFFFLSSLHDRWVAKSFQNKQTRKHANNSPLSLTVPDSPNCARPDTKKVPLKEQLKSNDCKLHDESPTDRLFPMKLGIGLPLTEKSTDSRRPAVEDMEVSFSKRSRLSYSGFQHSEDITCFLFEASTATTGSPTFVISSCLCGCQLYKNMQHFVPLLCSEPSMRKHKGTNMSNVHFTVAINSKPTIDKFSTCLTFSTTTCLISAAVWKLAGSGPRVGVSFSAH